MSCCDRRGLILGLAAATTLPGCFRPMLAEGGRAHALRGRIALPEPDGRFGYHLRRSLEDRLGRPGTTDWRLLVELKTEERGLAIAQDNAVTRVTVVVSARWQLVPVGGGKAVISDDLLVQAGYNSTGSLFATREADRDVRRRLAREIGHRISRSILARAGELEAGAS